MQRPTQQDQAERESFRKLNQLDLDQRRRRFRETTMAERLDSAFELSDFARELREGLRRT